MENKTIIRRSAPGENPVKVNTLEGIVEGYPIVFNARCAIADLFYEEIDPHALDMADLSDIKFFINHDDGMIPLARHRRGKRSTMDVLVDSVGLNIKTNLDIENNSTARALCSAVERGDIEDMSFAFSIEISGEEWHDLDKSMPLRRITKISRVCEASAHIRKHRYTLARRRWITKKRRSRVLLPKRWITKKGRKKSVKQL